MNKLEIISPSEMIIILFRGLFRFIVNSSVSFNFKKLEENSSSINTATVFFPLCSFGGSLMISRCTFPPSFIIFDFSEEESNIVVFSGLVISILLTKLVKMLEFRTEVTPRPISKKLNYRDQLIFFHTFHSSD